MFYLTDVLHQKKKRYLAFSFEGFQIVGAVKAVETAVEAQTLNRMKTFGAEPQMQRQHN